MCGAIWSTFWHSVPFPTYIVYSFIRPCASFLLDSYRLGVCLQNFHPFFLGNDYIGPAIDHFQEITARFPQVIEVTLAVLTS